MTSSRTSWVYEEISPPEPFYEIELNKCTSEQLQAKIDFLEKDVSKLQSECEVLELYVLKLHPEFVDRIYDVSWMPYHFKNVPNKPVVKKINKMKEFQRRMSAVLTTSRSSSIYAVVKRVNVNIITLSHLIFVVKHVLNTMDADYDNQYNELTQVYKKYKNETESFEFDYNETIKDIEDFKSEILELGYDKLTKGIPGEKYFRFLHKRLMRTDELIIKFRFLITDTIIKRKELEINLEVSKDLKNRVTVDAYKKMEIEYKNLIRDVDEHKTIQLKLKKYLYETRQEYLKEKQIMENVEKNLARIDEEIKQYEKKLFVQKTSFEKLLLKNEKNPRRRTPISNNFPKVQMKEYMALKANVDDYITRIEKIEKQLSYQNKNIHFHRQKLKTNLK